MKFGIFTIVPYHQDFTQKQALNDALEQVAFADQAGIDEAWLGEHRFSRHGLLSGIWSFLGAVAGRTTNIRIGTAVIVLPLHNPVLVAEEVAMLDVISGGRFNFGIGSGYQRQEFEGIGVDIDTSRDRFQESVDVIIKAWTEETLTYHGKFTDVDDVWVLAQARPTTLSSAVPGGEHQPGQHRLRRQPTDTGHHRRPTDILGQAPEVIKLWRQKMDEYGHPHAHLDPPCPSQSTLPHHGGSRARPPSVSRISRPASCAPSAATEPPSVCPWTRTGTSRRATSTGPTASQDRERRDDPGHAGLPPLRGTPEVVVERLKQVQEAGINHVFGNFGFAGLPHEKVMRSIELFATEVMPHFQEVPVA